MIEIRTMMRNLAGLKSTLFVPQETFEMLIKRQINRLTGPSHECVELVEQVRVSAPNSEQPSGSSSNRSMLSQPGRGDCAGPPNQHTSHSVLYELVLILEFRGIAGAGLAV